MTRLGHHFETVLLVLFLVIGVPILAVLAIALIAGMALAICSPLILITWLILKAVA